MSTLLSQSYGEDAVAAAKAAGSTLTHWLPSRRSKVISRIRATVRRLPRAFGRLQMAPGTSMRPSSG